MSEAGTSNFHFHSLEIHLVTDVQPNSLFIVPGALASSGEIRQLLTASVLFTYMIQCVRVCECVCMCVWLTSMKNRSQVEAWYDY